MTEYLAKTKYGDMKLSLLMDDLFKRQEEAVKRGEPQYRGFERWLDMWGEMVWAYAGRVTKNNIGGMQSTREWQDWAKANPDIVDKYPLVGGYLGPAGGDFSIDVWSEQLTVGAKDINDVKEASRQAQQSLGNYLYYKVVESLPPGQENTLNSRTLKANKIVEIESRFPDWSRPGASNERAREDRGNKIAQLRSMTEDKTLAGIPLVQALKEYFNARDNGLARATKETRGLTVVNWTNAKASLKFRNYLRNDLAPYLIQTTPEFKRVWDQVLSFEFIVDEG